MGTDCHDLHRGTEGIQVTDERHDRVPTCADIQEAEVGLFQINGVAKGAPVGIRAQVGERRAWSYLREDGD